jgi:AcrR family transcriptional regulator
MARQVRSEATRHKILDAAVEVFSEVGYAAAGWNTIIERTGMTKGALYHHFDSKESLASAVIEEGEGTLLNAFRNACRPSSPALENMIHGTFTIANVFGSDKMVRGAVQLTTALTGFNDAAAHFCVSLVELMAVEARRASAEGDLSPVQDPVVVSQSVIAAMFGVRVLCAAKVAGQSGAVGGDGDLITRTGQMWEPLLPGIVADASLAYFRQFLARATLRHTQTGTVPRREAASASDACQASAIVGVGDSDISESPD